MILTSINDSLNSKNLEKRQKSNNVKIAKAPKFRENCPVLQQYFPPLILKKSEPEHMLAQSSKTKETFFFTCREWPQSLHFHVRCSNTLANLSWKKTGPECMLAQSSKTGAKLTFFSTWTQWPKPETSTLFFLYSSTRDYLPWKNQGLNACWQKVRTFAPR